MNVYIGTVRPSRVIRMFEIRCDKQRHFACLAFFVLSPFFELIAAFTAPINAGATDTDKLVEALRGHEVDTPIGRIKFNEQGDAIGVGMSIYQIIHQLTEAGIGILMLTSDMVELIGLSDRTLVFYEGKIVKELSRGEITEERVMKAASGMTEE